MRQALTIKVKKTKAAPKIRGSLLKNNDAGDYLTNSKR